MLSKRISVALGLQVVVNLSYLFSEQFHVSQVTQSFEKSTCIIKTSEKSVLLVSTGDWKILLTMET